MNLNRLFLGILGSGFLVAGCGGGSDTSTPSPENASAESPSAAAPVENAVDPLPPPDSSGVATAAPVEEDPLAGFRVNQANPDAKNSDLEALQQAVDGYAYGPEGLGAPPLKNLNELVTKRYLRSIPEPPDGKKWAYDSQKWKVSLVDK